MSRLRGDRRGIEGDGGSVTAEFAAVLPAVVLVLASCLGALQIAGDHVRLTDAAATAARALSRGDGAARVASLVGVLVDDASVRSERRGDFVCSHLTAPVRAGPVRWTGLTLEATSCALAGGM